MVIVDVNGKKGPNTFCRDIYLLQGVKKNATILEPFRTSSKANSCKLNSSETTCGAQIIANKAYKIPKN